MWRWARTRGALKPTNQEQVRRIFTSSRERDMRLDGNITPLLHWFSRFCSIRDRDVAVLGMGVGVGKEGFLYG